MSNISHETLLIELCTEELPPKSLSQLSRSFSASILESLLASELIDKDTISRPFASPRRLGILVEHVASRQNDRVQQRKGPALQAAFDDNGEPTKAASGFARSCGVEVNDLAKTETEPGTWLTFEQSISGSNIQELAQAALDLAINNLPIPKRMRWGDSSEEFVRPVHKLLALHGESVLDLTAFGLSAGRETLGHRFHCVEPLKIAHANDYETILHDQGKVVADFAKRQQQIITEANDLAQSIAAKVELDPSLLDEVTGLVEWPVTIIGEFDAAFLAVPKEALIASMKEHQKYFHLLNAGGQLLPHFITVSNIESVEPERVVKGNERVLRARLSDGMFFWEQDKTQSLASRSEQLPKVLFHIKLGSVAQKVARVIMVANFIAKHIGANAQLVERAASLCKNDLVTNMVGEFPSLQGTMGRYYATNDKEDLIIAQAIEQHYWPKFAGDKLPESAEATAVALADRVDTMVGIFATGEKPSGVKDPYALRRATLGVIRMLLDNNIELSIPEILDCSIKSFQSSTEATVSPDQTTQTAITQFVFDRLRAYYTSDHFSANEFNAVAACEPSLLTDFDHRLRAIQTFYTENEEKAKSLAAANKRIANILRKVDYELPTFNIDTASEPAELTLAKQLSNIKAQAESDFAAKHYSEGLAKLASLRSAVDDFFDQTMVMDKDISLRNNRLALLQQLRDLFMQVADISHLVIEK